MHKPSNSFLEKCLGNAIYEHIENFYKKNYITPLISSLQYPQRNKIPYRLSDNSDQIQFPHMMILYCNYNY